MKKQTKPISLKKQLASAVSMMLAAAVALGSSTYAWFVNRSRAEVKDVLFQASAGKNLEIAAAVAEDGNTLGLNSGDQIPWDQSMMLTYYSTVTPEILKANSFTYPAFKPGETTENFMTPVSTVDDNLTINGSTATFFMNEGWDTQAQNLQGFDTYSTLTGQTGEKKYYICAQLYFRSSEKMNVYLNKDEWTNYVYNNDATNGIQIPYITQYKTSAMATDTNLINTYKLQAEELAKSLRISFVVADDKSLNKKTVVTARFDDGTMHVANAVWNTVNGAALITDDTPISTVDGTSKKITALGTAVTKSLDDYSLTGGSTGVGTNHKPSVSIDGKTPLFTLNPNEPKRVTVYIWLEGTDQDCVNTVSSYVAGVYLPFIGGYPTAEGGNEIETFGLDGFEMESEPAVVTEKVTENDTEETGYTVDEIADEPANTEESAAEGETQTAE